MSYVDGPQNNVEYIDARFTMVPFKPWGFLKLNADLYANEKKWNCQNSTL